jgi:hypothetical protein
MNLPDLKRPAGRGSTPPTRTRRDAYRARKSLKRVSVDVPVGEEQADRS